MSDSAELPLEVDVATVNTLQQQSESFVLLDVREENEYEIARIEGSLLIPMSQLGVRMDELESHQQSRIIVHCHHGLRSMQVTKALRMRGFARVQNMTGGIDDWSLQIDPQIARY